jgi:hypothetical protein
MTPKLVDTIYFKKFEYTIQLNSNEYPKDKSEETIRNWINQE